MPTKRIDDQIINDAPDGRLCVFTTDARSGDLLEYRDGGNMVVNDAKEALINSVISTSPSYRLRNIIAGNDIGDGTTAHHIVDMDAITSGEPTELANNTTEYTIDYNYNNAVTTLTVVGQNVQTYGDLVTALDGQVGEGTVSINTDGDIIMEAASTDPEELLFFIEDTDTFFSELNDFIAFNDAVNESNPDDPTENHTVATQSANASLIYDPSEYEGTADVTFGTRGSKEIIINRVFRGQEVLGNLGMSSSESIKLTSMVITTGNGKAFAYKRFPRLSVSNTVNVNVVWYIEYP